MSEEVFPQNTPLTNTAMPNLLNVPMSSSIPAKNNRRLSLSQGGSKSLQMRMRKNSLQASAENPQILKINKYAKLYENVFKDVKRNARHIRENEANKQKIKVKKSIERVIGLNTEQGYFTQRFQTSKSKSKKSRSISKGQNFGLTGLESQDQKRKAFFNNHRKVVDLEQDCLLLEYYLKDIQSQRSELSYLNGVSHTSRHRRITPTLRQNDHLFAAHDERENQSLKRRVHYKEQFVEKCGQIAKKNTTYRRRNNFKQIQYILNEHNRNIWQEIDCIPRDPQEFQRLKANNKLYKLYLSYKFMPERACDDEENTQQSYKKFKTDLFAIDPLFQMKENTIDKKINEIYKFKHHKAILFQDFKQLTIFQNQLYGKSILNMFQQKYPHYFNRKKDQILKEQWQEINSYMKSNKLKFLLEMMFRTYPDKLIGERILPVKIIPQIFKAYGISQKDFDSNELTKNYLWVQHHDTGITVQQFYQGSILWKMNKDNWKGIQTFLKKVNIQQYI